MEKKRDRIAQLEREKEEKKERARQKELRSYTSLFTSAEDAMVSNAELKSSVTAEAAVDYEDDFM